MDLGGGQTYYNGDIDMNGINTDAGERADAIRNLILIDPGIHRPFSFNSRQDDPGPGARLSSHGVAGTLRAVEYRDHAFGMALFQRMDLSEDRLLATEHVRQFIRANLRDSFSELRPVIERMLRSSEPEVCETGGVLAGLQLWNSKVPPTLPMQPCRGEPVNGSELPRSPPPTLPFQSAELGAKRCLSSYSTTTMPK